MKGKVNWFNAKKGYGFIIPEDGSKDIYVHYSGILSNDKLKNLEDGQQVEFDLSENNKGRMAIKVKVIEGLDCK